MVAHKPIAKNRYHPGLPAVFASSIVPLGGMSAVLYLGLLIDRFGPERALVALPYFALLAVMFFAGTTIIGSQTGANGACGALYPARMRTTGIGWAIGIGCLGSIASPRLGGYLLARGLPPTQIFFSACFFALVAATALLVLRGSPAMRLGQQPHTRPRARPIRIV